MFILGGRWSQPAIDELSFMSVCIYFSIKSGNELNGEIMYASIEDGSKGKMSSHN